MRPSTRPDHSADDLPGPGGLEDLIARTRRLREGVEALGRAESATGVQHRLRRAAWQLAAQGLDDVGEQLARLRPAPPDGGLARLGGRVGSAEWDLRTDAAVWSEELFAIFGREARQGPLTLDELPSCLAPEDRPALTAAVTGCLVDGRPVNCEVRVVRPDGSRRTVQMAGEPVLDDTGGTVAMWVLVRDVSELRRERAVPAPPGRQDEHAEQRRERRSVRAGQRVALELQGPSAAPWLCAAGLGAPDGRPAVREIAARYLPARTAERGGGKWYDALELPAGGWLLSVGDLSGRGPAGAADTATALGAVRGIALTGAGPGELLAHLSRLLDRGPHPLLGSAVCCRYEPGSGLLTWAQAGHPAPVRCRAGGGEALPRPAGTLLGAVTDACYAERTDMLAPDDVLVLHTDGLFSGHVSRPVPGHVPDHVPAPPPAWGPGHGGEPKLLGLAPRLAAAGGAGECLRLIADACEDGDRDDDACVLVVRARP